MLRLTTAIIAATLSLPALAGDGADITLRHLYAGTAEAGITELGARPDAESRFGKGMMEFAVAIEHLGQGLYRYGFAPTWPGGVRTQMLVPVPVNPNPEPVDYDKFRALLSTFVTDLDVAQKTLREAGVAGDYVISLDVTKVVLDIDGDGRGGPGENIAAVVGSTLGLVRTPEQNIEPIVLGLDRADAIWLAGYANIAAAQADFLLAHDFHELFDATFHRLFPSSGLPLGNSVRGQRPPSPGYELFDSDTEIAILDAVAFIHTIDWRVIEPERLRHVRERLLTLTRLSRENLAAIQVETDNNNELLPNPSQTAAVGRMGITAEQLDAWLATLDTLEQLLEGKLLLPHWRFDRGFDLRAYFENATSTDLVMLLTGYDALPFIKDGPIADEASFGPLNLAFGSNWPGYAFWFN